MTITNRDVNVLSVLSSDLAEQYKIKLACDLKDFSKQVHAAIEKGFCDYAVDSANKSGFEDLKEYKEQY